MTDHKAWGGAVGALIAMLVSRFVIDAVPFVQAGDYPVVHEAVSLIVGAALGYAATWWAPANKPKATR